MTSKNDENYFLSCGQILFPDWVASANKKTWQESWSRRLHVSHHYNYSHIIWLRESGNTSQKVFDYLWRREVIEIQPTHLAHNYISMFKGVWKTISLSLSHAISLTEKWFLPNIFFIEKVFWLRQICCFQVRRCPQGLHLDSFILMWRRMIGRHLGRRNKPQALFTALVTLPTGRKQTLALYVGPVNWFAPECSAIMQRPVCQLWPKSSLFWGAAIAQWIRLFLPSYRPGLKSQAHQYSYNFKSNLYYICVWIV